MGGSEGHSITTGQIRTFGVVDYVMFSVVLALSALIGMYYAYRDRKQVTTNTFMLAGKSMHVFPVAMSLTVTFLSALTLLGNPVEVYNFNTMFWWLVLSMLIAVAASAHVFMPFFYRLRVTTTFELVYFSFILYAPSLALNAVTNVSLWGSVLAIGLVVTFYTTLGGMKAVVWTDTFQAAIILVGLLAVFIQGAIVTGGFAHAWKVAEERNRIKFDDFNFDPSTRHSFWSVVVGGGFFWMSLYGVNQAQVQRCISCPSVKRAQLALWINLPGMVVIASLCFMIGVVMFAFYADCHPKGIITKTDQLLPLFVMDILADYQGVPGVFVACVFSGSLSSMSSGLNAISSITIKDLVIPYCCPKLSDFKTTLLTKIIVVVYGGAGMALAYVVGQLGRVLQASYSAYSILNGPMFGLFLLGMFFPWANSIAGWDFKTFPISPGAFVGCISALVFMSWIGIGAFWHGVSTATLSAVNTTGCTWNNITSNITTTTTTTTTTSTLILPADPTDIPAYPIYTLSYLYYTITGASVVIIVGLIVSFISGHTKPSDIDPRLICPLVDTVFPCLPKCVLKPFRCGINHTDKYEKYEQAIQELEADLAYQIKVSQGESVSPSTSSVSGPTASSVSEPTASSVSVPDDNAYENVAYEKDEFTSVEKVAPVNYEQHTTKL